MVGTVLTWLNRRRGAIVRSVARPLQAATAVPYCHVHSVPAAFTMPADFEVSAYPGLLAWHAVEASTEPKIISYWQDEPHYRYSRARFEKTLGIAAGQGWGGAAGDVHASKPVWWPASFKEATIAVAAVIGAVTVIWNFTFPIMEALWTTPKAEVTFAVTKVDLIEGDTPTPVTVNARNTTAFVPVHLVASASLLANDGSAVPVPLNPPEYQAVAPDAPAALTATLVAPPSPVRHAAHSDSKLLVSVAVRTWRFGRAATQRGELLVRVWPQLFGWTRKLRRIPQQDPRVYVGSGTLSSASAFPAGLQGTIMIVAPESADLVLDVLPPFIKKQQIASTPADSVKTTRMDFVTPPLEKCQDYPFQVTITSRQPLREGWDSIEKSIKLIFSDPRGG